VKKLVVRILIVVAAFAIARRVNEFRDLLG
jgi:hypothetical protein